MAVSGEVSVSGIALDQAAIASWTLEFKPSGASAFETVSSGNSAIASGVLGTWDTSGLEGGILYPEAYGE